MRILVLVDRVPERLSTSTPWHFLQELEPLSRAGHQVLVVSGNATEIEIPGVQFERVRFGSANSLRGVLRFPGFMARMSARHGLHGLRMAQRVVAYNDALRPVLARFRPDIMHSHWAWPAGSGGFLAARRARVPLVLTMRGYEHGVDAALGYGACLDAAYEGTLREALAAADRVTYCCENSRQRLAELGLRDAGRLVYLFHAVNADRLAARQPAQELRRALELDDGDRVVSCIALMHGAAKGHLTLLEAVARLASSHPRIRLVLIGDGEFRPTLEAKAESLGIASMVRFAGKVHPTAIGDHMRLSDVTVLPTHIEVFGNVVFESLLVGTPVISGAIGAANDVLPRGPYGQLFTPGDAEELAACIERVLLQPREHREQAARGGEFVRTHMSLGHRIDGFLKVYDELVANRNADARR